MDYQKLCPKSGHVLTSEERDALRARELATGEALALRCEACGRVVEVCMDPGSKSALIYPTHVRDVADLGLKNGKRAK